MNNSDTAEIAKNPIPPATLQRPPSGCRIKRLLPVNNIHIGIRVDRQVLQLFAHSCNQILYLGMLPTENPSEQCVAVWLEGLEYVDLVVATEFFHLGVFGPGALGELLLFSLINALSFMGQWVAPCKSRSPH